jgi:hypothetical protein
MGIVMNGEMLEVLLWAAIFLAGIFAAIQWGRWRKRVADNVVKQLSEDFGFNPETSSTRKNLYPNTGSYGVQAQNYRLGFFLSGSLGGFIDIRFNMPLKSKFIILKINPTMHATALSSPLRERKWDELVRVKSGDEDFDRKLRIYCLDADFIERLLTPTIKQSLLDAAGSNDTFVLNERLISIMAMYPHVQSTLPRLAVCADKLLAANKSL